jgi:hypothetical protein
MKKQDLLTDNLLPDNYDSVTNFQSGAGSFTLGTLPAFLQSPQGWSIEIWVYLDALVDQMQLISKPGEFQLWTQNGSLCAALANQSVILNIPNALQEHTWYFISLVCDGATLTIYLNAVLQGQVPVPSGGPTPTGNNWQIGGGFYGQISSCRYWTAPLQTQQISNNQWTDYAADTTNLAAQFDFTQNPPLDTSGNNISITPSATGNSFITAVPGVLFDGSGFCDPYNDESINPAGSNTDFSAIGWLCPLYYPDDTLNTDPVDNNMMILSNGPAESNAGFTLSVNATGNVVFQIGISPALVSNQSLQLNTWYNVAVTWAADTTTGTIFINGTQDSTASNMQLKATQQQGSLMIGAIASEVALLPVSNFQGYIQDISIWNSALTAAQISSYMNGDQQDTTGCLAYYDLSTVPSQNLITLNPVGLVSGAVLSNQETTSSINPASGSTTRKRVTVDDPPHAGTPTDTLPFSIDPKFLSDDFKQAMLDDFEKFTGKIQLPNEQQAALTALFQSNLEQAITDIQQGNYKNAFYITVEEGGNGIRRLRLHAEGTSEIVYEAQMSACTSAVIALIVTLLGAFVTAFGFIFNSTSFATGLTTFLGTRINSIGLTTQLIAVFNGTITVTSIYKALLLLHEFSLLLPLAKLSWQLLSSSLSWWSVVSLGVRIILIFSPAAGAELAWYVAQLAYSLYSVIKSFQLVQQECPNAASGFEKLAFNSK